MEDKIKINTESMESANQTSIYKMIVVGVVIGIFGVYIRFASENSFILLLVSWALLFIGAFLCCKSVFRILNS